MRPRKFRNFEFTGKYESVCFNGWDGKSYNGESEVLPAYQLTPFFRERMFNGNRFFVPKYTRKWGWTMHEIRDDWEKIGDAYAVDFFTEVEEVKD